MTQRTAFDTEGGRAGATRTAQHDTSVDHPIASALDRLIAAPRLLEIDHADLAALPARVWEAVRHGDLARSPLVRALFAVRTLPGRLRGNVGTGELELRIDDIARPSKRPGFRLLVDEPPREFAVGAIGKVWHVDIPFASIDTAEQFASFDRQGYVRVAWAVRVRPRGERDSRVEIELRVDATDEESWRKFRRYFRLIGPGSHYVRRSALAALAKELGVPEARENALPLSGDDLLPDAAEQVTHGITIEAPPERIWPWLVQMGCHRAGFYSVDWLDNAGMRSAREIHPELQNIRAGDVIPTVPEGTRGFEVLRVEAPRTLVLGGLYDRATEKQLPFAAPRPDRYWHVTWAFALEPLDAGTTRLRVRVRVALPPSGRLHAAWMRPVHQLMQTAQLRHLAARAEGRLASDDRRDVLEGVAGAGVMALALVTPFLRGARSHWGITEEIAARTYPGDDLIPEPRWSWTHGIEIDAPAEEVWPWVAQIGGDRAGFYSYQWLENVAGCELRNAERVHPEWEVREGDDLVLHSRVPAMRVVSVTRGRHFVAFGPPDEAARRAGRPWVAGSWLFMVEPLDGRRCRLLSRYRAECSDDVATRLSFGPTLVEPVGFAMDRRMLLGVKERAEQSARPAKAPGE
jgi:hypothetical protein